MISKIKQAFAFILYLFILAPASQSAENQSIFLGVTEPSQIHYVGEKVKTPFVIRVAFQCKNGIWQAMPNHIAGNQPAPIPAYDYPKEINWNLAFNSKSIGHFRSHSPLQWSNFSDIGLEEPETKSNIPSLKLATKAGASNFHYWTLELKNRPLVASSGHHLDDPDNWKPLVPLPHPCHELISAYRKATKGNTSHFSDKQILVRGCYKSRHNDELISLAVPSSEVKGDFDYVQWFHIQGNKANFLGSSLEFIDAGDYDNDGHSEIVFHKPAYNYDAYVLFYDNLQKQLEFGWSYH